MGPRQDTRQLVSVSVSQNARQVDGIVVYQLK